MNSKRQYSNIVAEFKIGCLQGQTKDSSRSISANYIQSLLDCCIDQCHSNNELAQHLHPNKSFHNQQLHSSWHNHKPQYEGLKM